MNADTNQKLSDHHSRIEMLEKSHSEVITALKDFTSAANELTTKFAVYSEKHDSVEEEQIRMRQKIDQHSEDLAAIKPFVESLRGLVWKIVGSAVLGGTGVAALITFAAKVGV